MARASFKIEWLAHEYEHKERTADWYWAVGIVAAAICITAIILGNVIFGILILVSAFALSLFVNRPPSTVHVIVDEKGVTASGIRYPYPSLHSFWIDAEHSHPRLFLRSQKIFMPLIHVPLGHEVDVDDLEESLLRHLPREFHGERWGEKFLEYLGF